MNDITLFQVTQPSSRKPIALDMEVNGKKLTMELDTGAAVSLISTHTKRQMFPEVPLPLFSQPTLASTYLWLK